jgi:GntR family transcriptional regulator
MEMKLLDRSSPIPLYHQLREVLVERMESGEFQPEHPIPTEMELIAHYGVSRMTVRRALQEMEKDGYIHRTAGKGTFVIPGKISRGLARLTSLTEDIGEHGLKASSRILSFRHVAADEEVAAKLQIIPGTTVIHIQRLRLAEHLPIALSTSYVHLPNDTLLTEADLANVGSLWSLLEKNSLPIVEADKTLEAIIANEERAAALAVPVGAPLLLVKSIAYAPHHQPIEYSQVINRGDQYTYTLHLTR